MIDDAMRAMIGAAELAKLLTRARQNLSEKPGGTAAILGTSADETSADETRPAVPHESYCFFMIYSCALFVSNFLVLNSISHLMVLI